MGQGVLTCGYSCTALRNYFKLWRTAEGERDWEVWHVSRWPAAPPPPPVERGIGEKKEGNVNAFSLLYSFSHFSSSPLSPLLRGALIPLHTRRSLQFSSFRKASHPRATLSFHFHHPYVVDFGAVSFSFHFPEPCFLFLCFLKLYFLSTLALFFHLLFLFMASLLRSHTRFVFLF